MLMKRGQKNGIKKNKFKKKDRKGKSDRADTHRIGKVSKKSSK